MLITVEHKENEAKTRVLALRKGLLRLVNLKVFIYIKIQDNQ